MAAKQWQDRAGTIGHCHGNDATTPPYSSSVLSSTPKANPSRCRGDQTGRLIPGSDVYFLPELFLGRIECILAIVLFANASCVTSVIDPRVLLVWDKRIILKMWDF